MVMSIQEVIQTKQFSLESFRNTRKRWEFEGHKLVFTNGCFDLLHAGHIHLLANAAQLGDRLVVALNSDSSVAKLKGEGKPITKQDDRSAILASIFYVNAVIIFQEDTPLDLIKTIKPEVLVKGGDYNADEIVGSKEVKANGGTVEIIPFLEGYSTTAIIDR